MTNDPLSALDNSTQPSGDTAIQPPGSESEADRVLNEVYGNTPTDPNAEVRVSKTDATEIPPDAPAESVLMAEEGWTWMKYLYPHSIRIPWAAGKHDDPRTAYFELPFALSDLFEKVFIDDAPSPKICRVNTFKRLNEETGQSEIRHQYRNDGVPGIAFERDKCTALPIEIAEQFKQRGGTIFRDMGRQIPKSEMATRVPRRSSHGFYEEGAPN